MGRGERMEGSGGKRGQVASGDERVATVVRPGRVQATDRFSL